MRGVERGTWGIGFYARCPMPDAGMPAGPIAANVAVTNTPTFVAQGRSYPKV
jgi:hypothetical protein